MWERLLRLFSLSGKRVRDLTPPTQPLSRDWLLEQPATPGTDYPIRVFGQYIGGRVLAVELVGYAGLDLKVTAYIGSPLAVPVDMQKLQVAGRSSFWVAPLSDTACTDAFHYRFVVRLGSVRYIASAWPQVFIQRAGQVTTTSRVGGFGNWVVIEPSGAFSLGGQANLILLEHQTKNLTIYNLAPSDEPGRVWSIALRDNPVTGAMDSDKFTLIGAPEAFPVELDCGTPLRFGVEHTGPADPNPASCELLIAAQSYGSAADITPALLSHFLVRYYPNPP